MSAIQEDDDGPVFRLTDAWERSNGSVPRTNQQELTEDLQDRMQQAAQDAVLRVLNEVTEYALERGFVTDESSELDKSAVLGLWRIAFDDALGGLFGAATRLQWLAKRNGVEPIQMQLHRCRNCGASAEANTIGPIAPGDIVTETYHRDDPESVWVLGKGSPNPVWSSAVVT